MEQCPKPGTWLVPLHRHSVFLPTLILQFSKSGASQEQDANTNSAHSIFYFFSMFCASALPQEFPSEPESRVLLYYSH